VASSWISFFSYEDDARSNTHQICIVFLWQSLTSRCNHWDLLLSYVSIMKRTRKIHNTDTTSITQRVYLCCELQIIERWPVQRSERSKYEKDAILSRWNVFTQLMFTLMLPSSPHTHPFAADTSVLWRMQSRVRIRLPYELHILNKDEVVATYSRKLINHLEARWSLHVTIRLTFCPQCIYVFRADLRTDIITLYNIRWLFISVFNQLDAQNFVLQ